MRVKVVENTRGDFQLLEMQESTEVDTREENKSRKSYYPGEGDVKRLGRTYALEKELWFALSATGVEFQGRGSHCEVTLLSDEMRKEAKHCVRAGIFVDGQLVFVQMLTEAKTQVLLWDEEATKVVRIVKLSESSDSTMGLGEIRILGEICPTPEKCYKLEIIGDSITCGYGIDGVLGDEEASWFADATKTYAYQTAKNLDVDYSLVSFTGHGILSGFTGEDQINLDMLVPPYYEKLGHSLGHFQEKIEPFQLSWNFQEFQPDCIVINLGTNDSSYCVDKEERCLAFQESYVEFLAQVRRCNPKAYLVCTYGIMGDSLFPYVEEAARIHARKEKDERITTMKFQVQQEEDGFSVNWHPTVVTQNKATQKLTEFLRDLDFWSAGLR